MNKVKLNSIGPHGILSIPIRVNNNRNILTEYQLISSANIEDAFTACTENHAIQNAKAFYAMSSKSVTGTIYKNVS